MTNEQEIARMAKAVPQTIVAYDRNPNGLHLYGEQREEIAEKLIGAGIGDKKQAVKEAFESVKQIVIDLSQDVGIECSVVHTQRLLEQLDDLFTEIYGVDA